MPGEGIKIKGLKIEDWDILTERIESSINSIVELSDLLIAEVVTAMPQNDDYQDGRKLIFVDEMGQVGTRGDIYFLFKYRRQWYKLGPFTALR